MGGGRLRAQETVSTEAFNQVALPCLLVVGALVCCALPLWWVWRRSGIFPIFVHRAAHPLQRWHGAWLGGSVTGFAIWIALYSLVGPDGMGVWSPPAAVGWVGWILAVLGLLLVVMGQTHLGPSWRIGIDDRCTTLVTGGVYRLIRNPIFAGMLLMFGGVTMVTPSPWTIMGWAILFLAVGGQTRAEEEHLTAIHGERYCAYAARVGRFVPGVGRLSKPPGEARS